MAKDTGTPGTLDVEFTPEPGLEERFSNRDDEHGTATKEKLRGAKDLVKGEAGKLTGQAGEKLRALADDGKARATSALDELAKTIEDAAATIDEKVGPQFGGYARSASGAVTNFAENLRGKDIDDLVDDARDFVRKSPGVAIGAAAAVGFVLARLVQSGIDANRNA
ncbi:hypothetical protein [Sphingomonas sp. Leaf33]|uniref:hypothetical protein n=1 Tax=Sphingomonas sp. Leaf33 TaxID=1736215 RepID=UPI000B20AAE4|nr:hypothetical protein [Sphingomonas sp. Leaf33]